MMDQDFLRFRQQHRTVPLDPWRSPLLEEPRIDEESLETEHDIWKVCCSSDSLYLIRIRHNSSRNLRLHRVEKQHLVQCSLLL